MHPDAAKRLLDRMAALRLMVIGDLMLDEYVWGTVDRISPEAPIPVVRVERVTTAPGGAANVVRNAAALGAQVRVVGVVGADEAGEMLLREMAALGADTESVHRCDDRPTTQKTRIIAQNQQMLRVDREGVAKVDDSLAGELLDCVRAHLSDCDAIILSDYDKGVICKGLVPRTIEAARERDVLVTSDPKPVNMELLAGSHVVCPNEHEAAFAVAMPISDEESLSEAAGALLKRFRADAVLITRGPRGMSLFAADGETQYVPAAAEEVYDVTGAGDTVVASFTMALAAGASRRDAMELATVAAGNVVRKLGAATTSAEEILHSLEERDA